MCHHFGEILCDLSSEEALTLQGEEGGSEAGLQAGTQKSAAKTVGFHWTTTWLKSNKPTVDHMVCLIWCGLPLINHKHIVLESYHA